MSVRLRYTPPMALTPFTHPALEHDRILHGFFGREGGISEGLYRGLNCGPGSNDVPHNVAANRALVAAHLGVAPTQLCTLYQIHSPHVLTVHAPFGANRPQADAMVTDIPGIALGILTADCGPVLFADAEAGVIGAAHAGWKGAYYGVLENTVAAMEALGAKRENIAAVLGPTIAQASYEVGPEFIERFTSLEQETFFSPSTRDNHHQFNLPAYIGMRLGKLNLAAIGDLAMDTSSNEPQFFSYRRTTLRGEPDYGRQVSVIALE